MKHNKRFISLFLVWIMVLSILPLPALALTLEERVKILEERIKKNNSVESTYISKIGGRIQADWTLNTHQSNSLENEIGKAEDGFEFRRIRLFAKGAPARNITYKLQLDFAGNKTSIKDAFFRFKDKNILPGFKIGHFKEPFGLNELTSSKYITFMSRAALSDGFTPGYNPGIQTDIHLLNDRFNLTLGLFTPDDQTNSLSGGSTNLSARFSSPLIFSQSGQKLVHLGLSYSHRSEGDKDFTGNLEPEVHKGDPKYLEVAIPGVENTEALGIELATVYGPFSLQTEWAQNNIQQKTGNSLDLTSKYISASYFLSGEHRPYNPAGGVFSRVHPGKPFQKPGSSGYGPGAWEIAARYSETDYTEGKGYTTKANNLAGKMNIVTLGLNWYPTSHTRWMVNYVDGEQETIGGDSHWVSTRFQLDF